MNQPASVLALEEPVPAGVPGIQEQRLAFSRNGLSLQGTLALPETPAAEMPIGAITLHGWGGSRTGPHRFFVELGRELAALGIPALRFDLSGRGLSDGEEEKTTLDDMIADALAAMDALQEAAGVKGFALIGLCSGGNVAIGAATLRPEAVTHLTLISTFPFAPRSSARGRAKAWGYFKGYLRKACSLQTWKRLLRGEVNVGAAGKVMQNALHEADSKRANKDSTRDIMADFAEFNSPCHFLYGGGDPEAPEAQAHYEAFCAANQLKAQFTVIDSANHNFYSARWAEELQTAILRAVPADIRG